MSKFIKFRNSVIIYYQIPEGKDSQVGPSYISKKSSHGKIVKLWTRLVHDGLGFVFSRDFKLLCHFRKMASARFGDHDQERVHN